MHGVQTAVPNTVTTRHVACREVIQRIPEQNQEIVRPANNGSAGCATAFRTTLLVSVRRLFCLPTYNELYI